PVGRSRYVFNDDVMSLADGLANVNGISAASCIQSTRNKRCHRKPERKLPRSWRQADGGDGENGEIALSFPARAYSVIEKTYQGVRNRKYKITVFTVITVTHSRAVGSRKHFVYRRR